MRIAGALVVIAVSVLCACGGSDAEDSPTPSDRADGAVSFVDGEPYEGNIAEIELVDRREIAIVVGSPPEEVPSDFDFVGV